MKDLTLEILAKKLKLSRRTLSRAMRGEGYVSAKNREKILSCLRETRYSKNFQASNLRSGLVKSIGLVFPVYKKNDPGFFVNQVLTGTSRAAQGREFHVVCASQNPFSADVCREWVRGRVVSGIVLVSPSQTDLEMVDALRKENIPFVALSSSFPGVDCIDSDNVAGAYLATRHLIESGRRKIAFLHGHPGWANADDRYQGYQKALAEAGIPLNKRWVLNCFFDSTEARKAVSSLFEKSRPVNAVFAANDLSAFGALAALRDQGIRVPEDVSVSGYDDHPICSLPIVAPNITSVSVPMEEMAFVAAERLISKILARGKPSKADPAPLFLPKLIIRESTAGI